MNENTLKHVYKASAGSGKTFTLTTEYLAYLFDEYAKNPNNPHSHILAVTFTNASTRDMKTKILSELYILAYHREQSKHIAKLSKRLQLPEEKIVEGAHNLLRMILQDYSMFQISTIDRFFLAVMRAFIRELALNETNEIELDNEDALTHAIENLFAHLDNNKDLLEWLKDFSLSNIEEDKNWNPKEDIKKLSKELNKEDFKQILNDKNFTKFLQSKSSLKDYQQKLRGFYISIEKEIKGKAQQLNGKLNELGLLPEDFRNGWIKTFLNPFKKIEKEEFSSFAKEKLGTDSAWFPQRWRENDPCRSALIQQAENELCSLLNDLAQAVNERYYTAKELCRTIHILGILLDVEEELKDYTQTEQLTLLSSVGDLIQKIINGSDTPFIYEKIGTLIDHYLIDEFQDTSKLQYNNFKPLVKESLDRGNENFIVGDVKQCIYRWRNSDWTTLNKMEGEPLKYNHRSCWQIVDFNNRVFEKLRDAIKASFDDPQLQATIATAYSDIEQHLLDKQDKKGGYVETIFWKKPAKEEKQSQVEEIVNRIVSQVKTLHETYKYPYNTIAILVRKNDKASKIAQALMTADIPVLSNEALDAKKSPSVQLLLHLLRALCYPNDTANAFLLLAKYYFLKQDPDPIVHAVLNKDNWSEVILGEQKKQLLRGSFSMQVGNLITHLCLPPILPNETIYIQTLLDEIITWEKRHGSDISGFIEWWDSQKDIKVDMPMQNAVQILTVHKSKGLEFPNVIYPMWDDELDSTKGNRTEYIWCKTEGKGQPFDTLPYVPITYNAKMANTIFKEEYEKEKLNRYIDTLNLTYVAFTRAKQNLFLHAMPYISSTGELKNISAHLKTSIAETSSDENHTQHFSWGTITPYTTETTEENSENKKRIEMVLPITNARKITLKQINFTSEATEQGVALHTLLSRIKTADDLDTTAQLLIQQGILTPTEWQQDEPLIRQFINRHSEWYSSTLQTLNEKEILSPNQGEILRPDRVMINNDKQAIVIDYKFGTKISSSYEKQIKQYMTLLKNMGYTVQGYICYIRLEKEQAIIL